MLAPSLSTENRKMINENGEHDDKLEGGIEAALKRPAQQGGCDKRGYLKKHHSDHGGGEAND